jgi:hypothetical protein
MAFIILKVELSRSRRNFEIARIMAAGADQSPHPGSAVDDAICKRRQRIKVCPADIAVSHLAHPVDRFASGHIAPK